MFSLNNQLELRRVTLSSLVTCIYVSTLVAIVSYKGLLYTVGKASACFNLIIIFVAEIFKSFYLRTQNDSSKKIKPSRNRFSDIMKSISFLITSLFCFFVGIILFGAPVLEQHEETLMLSALLTLLTVFPLTAHCGVESAIQLLFKVRNYGKDPVVEMLLNNAFLTISGAWLGALVIPLDWNTPWQQWPIPCYLGAVGGYLLSNVLNVLKISLMNSAEKYPMLNVFVNIINKNYLR